jgi:hypothetical protein
MHKVYILIAFIFPGHQEWDCIVKIPVKSIKTSGK